MGGGLERCGGWRDVRRGGGGKRWKGGERWGVGEKRWGVEKGEGRGE